MRRELQIAGVIIASGLAIGACTTQPGAVVRVGFNPYINVRPVELARPLESPPAPELPPPQMDLPSDVLFAFASARLRRQADFIVALVAEKLRRDPRLEVEIRGYTDTSGRRTYNQRLSEERAHAVADAVIQAGTEPERVEAHGFGATNLKVLTRQGVREPRNRRVEIIFRMS